MSVSLSPLNTQGSADNPAPAVHRMNLPRTFGEVAGSVQLAKDFVGADYHNEGHTHIDAFCHVGYEGKLYNGTPAGAVTDRGATADSIEVLENGLAGRGVLLDIPRAAACPGSSRASTCFARIWRRRSAQGVTVGPGDILLVRTGLVRRLNELGAGDVQGQARSASARDAVPRRARGRGTRLRREQRHRPEHDRGVEYPIHVLALNAMGVHLLDYLQLEELTAACEQYERWEFLFVAAPPGSPAGPDRPSTRSRSSEPARRFSGGRCRP